MRIDLASPEEWETLARSDGTATFFQTPAWHKLAEDFEGTISAPLRFEGNDTMAILPLQSRKRWWGKLFSTPFGTYSSLLKNTPLSSSDLARLSQCLSALNLNLPGSPFSNHLTANLIGHSLGTTSHTHVLNLGSLDPSAWIGEWSRNHRRLLKSAQETGYTVRLAENAADIAAYFSLYRMQTQRWGRAARRIYPEELFQEAFRRFAVDGSSAASLRIWLAEGSEGIAGGRLCLYHGFHAVEWHPAATPESKKNGVNHLLVQAIVSHAKDAGFEVYDFNPNPGLEAVDHFKRGFATSVLPFEGIKNRSGLVNILSKAPNSFRSA